MCTVPRDFFGFDYVVKIFVLHFYGVPHVLVHMFWSIWPALYAIFFRIALISTLHSSSSGAYFGIIVFVMLILLGKIMGTYIPVPVRS